MKTIEITGFPFVNHVNQDSRPKLKIDYLNNIYSDGYHSQFHNISASGFVKIMGYKYDFRLYLKKILVKQYGSWQEYYAPNKTTLRKCIGGRIEKMIYLNQ